MDRRPYEQWHEKKDGARQWANQRAQDILATHHPDPLDEKLSNELKQIIGKYESSLGSLDFNVELDEVAGFTIFFAFISVSA